MGAAASSHEVGAAGSDQKGEWIAVGFAMGERAEAVLAQHASLVLARAASQLSRMFPAGRTSGVDEHAESSWADAVGCFVGGSVVAWGPEELLQGSGAVHAHPHVLGGYTRAHPLDRIECARIVPRPEPPHGKTVSLPDGDGGVHVSAGLAMRRALARPAWGGRLLFAGEATSGAFELWDSPMTVHGAMLTGERAALEALQRIEVERAGGGSSRDTDGTDTEWSQWPWRHLPAAASPAFGSLVPDGVPTEDRPARGVAHL